ncbi:MAG: hypothetical protein GYA55_15225, partial [SAR324 cluster bacterium]|nr:hypothetical protein [SAR324 cluster bacterium]
SDLVAGDTNGYSDVFLRNVASGSTTRISLDFAGGQGNDESETSSISSSGRFIAFESKASLVGTHYESDLDIFLVDRGADTPNQDVLPVVEDFSDGTIRGDSDWSVKSGAFRVNKAGQYQSAGGKNNVSLLKTLAAKPFRFSSGEIEIEIKLPNTRAYTPRAGLLFAYQSSVKYRYVQMQPGAIVFGQRGRIGTSAPLNKSKALKIKKGTTYTLRVKLQSDGRILIYVGDRLVSSYKFKSSESGAVGVFSPQTQAYFDNVHIF